MVVKKPGT